jgi:predicted RNA binding protein YcfA (HicA-like mRNA interferase family)
MDKLAKILGLLREADLLHGKRESRIGERTGFALDLDSLRNPTQRDLGKLDSWIHGLDAIFGKSEVPENAGWHSESDENNLTQPLAWYQPLTYYHETAGIYITDYGIWTYLNGIRSRYLELNEQQLFKTPLDIDSNQLILAAIEALLAHETFHHDVEWFALKQGATHASHWIYPDYDSHEYKKSDPLEEALATARMQLHFASRPVRSIFGESYSSEIVNYLRDEVASLPRGYSNANAYNTRKTFEQGRRELAASINQTTIHPRYLRSMPHFGIQKGVLSDYFRENVILVPWGTAAGSVLPPDSMAFSMPSRDIKKLLKSRGYWETQLGNGSHRVWKHKTQKAITLPERGNFEGYQVLKNICKSLGLDGLEALREATKEA